MGGASSSNFTNPMMMNSSHIPKIETNVEAQMRYSIGNTSQSQNDQSHGAGSSTSALHHRVYD